MRLLVADGPHDDIDGPPVPNAGDGVQRFGMLAEPTGRPLRRQLDPPVGGVNHERGARVQWEPVVGVAGRDPEPGHATVRPRLPGDDPAGNDAPAAERPPLRPFRSNERKGRRRTDRGQDCQDGREAAVQKRASHADGNARRREPFTQLVRFLQPEALVPDSPEFNDIPTPAAVRGTILASPDTCAGRLMARIVRGLEGMTSDGYGESFEFQGTPWCDVMLVKDALKAKGWRVETEDRDRDDQQDTIIVSFPDRDS